MSVYIYCYNYLAQGVKGQAGFNGSDGTPGDKGEKGGVGLVGPLGKEASTLTEYFMCSDMTCIV